MGLVILIGIGIVVYFIWQGAEKGTGPFKKEDPIDILKKRYANGEITREQFEQMKKDLGG